MTESDFYSDEFEQLIREKTEQYKMYPSEKVWKEVHSSLHTRRRWFFIGMSSLIIGILLYAGRELLLPSAHTGIAKRSTTATTVTTDSSEFDNNGSAAAIPAGRHHSSSASIDDDKSGKDERSYKWVTVSISDTQTREPDISDLLSRAVTLPDEAPALPITAARIVTAPAATSAGDEKTVSQTGALTTTASGGNTQGQDPFPDKEDIETDAALSETRVTRQPRNGSMKNALAATKPEKESVSGKETLTDPAGEAAKNAVPFTDAIADQQKANWLQDYAFYNLTMAPRRNRKFLQLYLTPMISYRSLSGGNFSAKSTTLNVPVAFHLGEAKDYVDHNPAFGFEMGGLLQYRLTRNLTVKGGLQFNFSRYTIRAYASNPQQATIALNSYYGYYLDSLTAITNIRNFGGKTPVSLNNDYYQLSAPVGFELRIMGNERLQLNVGATVQPTYLLNTNSYLLTTDYTNYTREPSLFRRWNVSGALEAFLTYNARNGIRWQVGPEFRYQMMSTYDSQYPIHENLKGYGIKLGISKALP